ncbi:DUF5718 family protein [Vibrio gazogenes]|uniref:Uncharacterized protein n=1 Tax=Vibrio gazogenes TaxID=687 RepID=A0A1Z2SBB7_VIBGA|nr:DUF5718 family protein [Vibrio gazogenes]ASA54488.1 hypothetical protein BSQ33_01245 [Vibrio gazogenes]
MIFGISGNFKGHLGQVNKGNNNIDIPGCIFPIYAKGMDGYLSVYPVSEDYLRITNDYNYQIEPEISLFFDVQYKDGKVVNLSATHYTLFNDCSIRSNDIKKISLKKNWGTCSKGAYLKPIPLCSYAEDSELENLRIVSFVKRNNVLHQYNEDCSTKEYTFKYDTLLSWIKDTINSQEETEVKDDLINILESCDFPETIQIAIGATRYTDFGKDNFLKNGDEVFILLYKDGQYDKEEIEKIVNNYDLDKENIVNIYQKVII